MTALTASLLVLFCAVSVRADADEVWSRRERLQKLDLRTVKPSFLKKSESMSRFYVADKLPIDSTYSVIVVTATDERQPGSIEPWYGVFVVYGKLNQVYMVLHVAN